ncbi:MAG: universal stress protein [Thermoleophilaceae bacterium]
MAPDGPVLLAYDGSDSAKAAISEAGRLLALDGAEAIVGSVWQSAAAAAPATVIAIPAGVARQAYEELDREAEEQAKALADEGVKLARDAGFEATSRPIVCDVNTWSTIVELADETGASAIVVGTRGHSGVKSALLGSVSSGVVHHARQPVLVVRG